MAAVQNQERIRLGAFRRSLKLLRKNSGEGNPIELCVIKDQLLGFVEELQKKYPFTFAVAYRNFKSELNKQAQERMTTHFLIGAIAELTTLESDLKERVWALGGLLSKQIGKGGENFRPRQFNRSVKAIAEEIGEKNFSLLIEKANELSAAFEFKMGPVNSGEHVILWSFRYVGQFLKAAKWEGTKRSGTALGDRGKQADTP
jgi:hypothetical protein